MDDAAEPHRQACRGQRSALPTAPAFAHKLHSLLPPVIEDPNTELHPGWLTAADRMTPRVSY